MDLYLAHPFEKRIEIRELEIEIENETKINLINPFYDCKLRVEDMIERVDKGKNSEFPPERIVEHDLEHIKASNGLLALVYDFPEISNTMIGTPIEMFYCARELKRPVISWVFSDRCKRSPWVTYHSEYITTSKDDLIRYLKNLDIENIIENPLACVIY